MLQPSAVVELIWQDDSGDRSATTLFTSSSLAAATIEDNALALSSLVAPLTDCVLVGLRIKYKTAYEAELIPSGPNVITHAGVLFFATDDAGSSTLINIPAVSDGVFVTEGPGAGAIIDLTNADVSAFITAVLDAGLTTPFAVPLLDVIIGYLQSRL